MLLMAFFFFSIGITLSCDSFLCDCCRLFSSPGKTGHLGMSKMYFPKAHTLTWRWNVCALSCVWLFATPWTVASQAPLSMGFSRQEYWSGLPFPSPMHACMLSRVDHVRLYATPWTAAHQAPPSTGFSRQEYWRGVSFPYIQLKQCYLSIIYP